MRLRTPNWRAGKITLVFALCSLLGPAMRAQETTYTFVGAPFNSFYQTNCPPICRLTGSFTLAQPLPPNLKGNIGGSGDFTPTSFSFTDGLTTLTNLNSDEYSGFAVDTDANGNITSFSFYMGAKADCTGFFAYWDGPKSVTQEGTNLCNYQAYIQGVGVFPGTWTRVSTTVLSVSPINATAGQVVTLTARVFFGDGEVTVGTVTFSSGKQALGTVQLVQNGGAQGTATLKIRFAPGTYTLTARFNGTNFNSPSQSQPQQYTVTGTEPTITTLTATAKPDGSNYDFTASVFGFGFPAPTGTASFTDLTTTPMTNLGMVPIAGPGTLGFQLPASLPVGNVPEGIASGDFNGHGIADLAVTNSGDKTVSVLLGNGDGTFNAQQTYPVGGQPAGIAVGDFNGDGIADLAVPNASDNNVSVLLGNADGTFPQQNPTYGVGVMPFDIAVADFNGDGIADLAVTNSGEGTVSVLLGNGDGTFPQENPTYGVGGDPIGIAVGDFNGDGCPDLAVTNLGDNTVSVLLGNVVNQECDGSFQPQQTYPAGVAPYGIAIAEIDGDGFADLAVTNTAADTVSVLLGNGDGTFPQQNPPTYGVGEEPAGIAVADFNGDGFADLAVSSRQNATISVLLGKGNGAFQPQQAYGGGNIGIAVTDLNGDGVPDIAAVDNGPNTVSILLGGTVTSGPPLNVPVIGLNQTIQSTYTPNLGFYRRSLSNEVVVNGCISTTTKVTSSQNPSQFNQPVTFTATVNFNAPPVNFNVRPNDGGGPTGTVNFTDNGTIIAGCGAVQLVPQQNGGTATCQTSSLTLGSPQTIVATYGGGGNFAPSMGTLKPPQVVSKANTQTALTAVPPQQSNYQQLVTFTATVTGAFGGSPTGTVNFTDNGTIIAGCGAVQLVPQQNGGTATCQTSSLTVG